MTDSSFATPLFLLASLAIVLVHTWSGWALGLPLALVRVVGLGGGVVCGIWASRFAPDVIRGWVRLPDAALAVVGGIFSGLLAWGLISIVGGILFKRTRDQKGFFVKGLYGLSGAAVGLVTGLALVWAGVIAVRLLGAVAGEQLVAMEHRQGAAHASDSGTPASAESGNEGGRRRLQARVVRTLATLRQELDQGIVGAFAQLLDPIPDSFYLILSKGARVMSYPETMSRLLDHPGVANLSKESTFRALVGDLEIAKLARAGDYLALMRHEKVIAAANDPDLLRAIQALDIEGALDFALQAIEAPVQEKAPPPRDEI
ncbi:MAG: hypothetical protein SNJ52_04765 [Verrucomicrobiia bacterium]